MKAHKGLVGVVIGVILYEVYTRKIAGGKA